MWKYFSANDTKKYIDISQQLIDKYNNTYHHSIGSSTTIARQPASYQHVFNRLYDKKVEKVKRIPKFHLGQQVQILRKKKTFEKRFTPNCAEELFTISSVKDTKTPTYSIQDMRSEKIQGSFYEKELHTSEQTVFRIEKEIKNRRTRIDGVEETYVKWKGYNND